MEGSSSNLNDTFTSTRGCAEPMFFPQRILPLLPLYNAQWWGYESLTAIALVLTTWLKPISDKEFVRSDCVVCLVAKKLNIIMLLLIQCSVLCPFYILHIINQWLIILYTYSIWLNALLQNVQKTLFVCCYYFKCECNND